MSLGNFANTTSACTAPLLDEALFGKVGGYTAGRYCGLGSFEDGTTCCFPCPIQDWIYPPEWKHQLRVPNYLSVLSVILCSFLLLSFAVLPSSQTHRHYLSVGLLVPVLFIALSFVIPVGIDPPLCYDAITPNDMRSSMSCAWTGSLVTFGGLGCAIWVFLRSLWLHIRIFWDRDPGKYFKWGSILAGTLLPLAFLIAILTSTGFSYRMGQTCLPNHENAIATFWIWLVVFSIAGFLLQVVTTGYCVYVYSRTLRRERRNISHNSLQHGQSWKSIKKLFLLQWRNIAVSVFVIIGSLVFFIVFWTQDSKLGRVFNDPENIKPVKTWIICNTLSRGDKKECIKYVGNFTVPRPAVLTSLILASLVGIEIFILLFRQSMLRAWLTLLTPILHRARIGRPPSPQLTSLENPEKYLATPSPTQQPNHFVSTFSSTDRSTPVDDARTSWAKARHSGISVGNSDGGVNNDQITRLSQRPQYDRVAFDTAASGTERSRSATPLLQPPPLTSYTPSRTPPNPPSHPLHSKPAASAAPNHSNFSLRNLSLAPSRGPPQTEDEEQQEQGTSGRVQRSESGRLKDQISTPVPGTFVHVGGAFMEGRGGWGSEHGRGSGIGPLGVNVTGLTEGGGRTKMVEVERF
ncbi:hypothetical protein BDV95DRAFT_623358 [Massariosphaeria phaeospora]|uniref:G-protein coupled receptors family 2 profile 2 domain-containing protein n=1 Tax=Massariosphaeria phaeospora TaxID=100035 RepID=A0A7C8M0D8_9PLEO|nr:hypothetical protein BDV95DRAFT_623358 [Massariosphaeria phaeospora]